MQFDAPLKKLRYPAIFAKRVSVCFYGDQSWLLPRSQNTPLPLCRSLLYAGRGWRKGSIKRRWRQFYAANGTIHRAAWERTPREDILEGQKGCRRKKSLPYAPSFDVPRPWIPYVAFSIRRKYATKSRMIVRARDFCLARKRP